MKTAGAQLAGDACGSFARGFRQLQKFFHLRTDKNGVKTYKNEPQPPSSDSDDPPQPGEPPQVVVSFSLTPTELLTQPRNPMWAHTYPEKLFAALVGSKVRASRTSPLAWVEDEGAKKGWKNVNPEEIRQLFERVREFHIGVLELLNAHRGHAEFVKMVGYVPPSKYHRIHYIEAAVVDFKGFMRFLRAEHERLPSVCGRRVLSV